MSYNKIVGVLLLSLCVSSVFGQKTKTKRDYGRLSGSIESGIGYYLKDKAFGISKVDEPFATNTYLNLGYKVGNFSFGAQYEIYRPPMVGLTNLMEGNKLMYGFGEYRRKNLSVRLGNMYEQFGSGLMFRSYEDRALGFNNSLLGANVTWSPNEWGTIKLIAGVPRKYLKYASTAVYGADAELDIMKILGVETDKFVSIGGGWLMRDDKNKSRVNTSPAAVQLGSLRANATLGVVTLGAEYVAKGKSLASEIGGLYYNKCGSAMLLNAGVDWSGIGVSAEFRRVENMKLRVDDNTSIESVNINYVPSLTRQHKYALASLFPHELLGIGEIGGQLDIFGEIGDRHPVSFAINGSHYRKLDVKDPLAMVPQYKFMSFKGEALFSEVGVELETKFGQRFKSIISYMYQQKPEFSKNGFGDMIMNSHVVVGDFLYKFTDYTSLRMELQHLWSDSKDDSRWAMGLLELGLAPRWMLFASDMCNYQTSGKVIHYYSAGGSFVWRTLRTSLSYGRNRAGMQCSGGVCRFIPQYTGFNFLLTFTI